LSPAVILFYRCHSHIVHIKKIVYSAGDLVPVEDELDARAGQTADAPEV
jgi:hypothetical protein